MGLCWCKEKAPDELEIHAPSTSPETMEPAEDELQLHQPKSLDSIVVDQLVADMLLVIASLVDHDDEPPVPLVKLHLIADTEEGWLQVVSSMVNVIPVEDPLGPSVITIIFDDCPLPSRHAVRALSDIYMLSKETAYEHHSDYTRIRIERNISVVLGCIAEKFAGPNSVAVLTQDTLEFLIGILVTRRESSVVLFALIALEKFAHTTDNKLKIKEHFDMEPQHPLLELEQMINHSETGWRQVAFCAQWSLDNLFVIEGRKLSYELADMSNITVILNTEDVSEYLKISPNGLEARCDSYSFESVRCTYQVDSGCCYYECEIVTPGVMQIGWATKNSHFMNHEGYGIGDDLFSMAYDGCRRLLWYKAKSKLIQELPKWKSGDILGCLIDLVTNEVIFSLNGERLPPNSEIFKTIGYVRQNVTKHCSTGFFAAASFMAFQHCRFNFGHKPFKYPPTDRLFTTFNEYGGLTDDQKRVVPRSVLLKMQKWPPFDEGVTCPICCDEKADCTLEPCLHSGICSLCTAQLDECPLCRATIVAVKRNGVT